LQQALEPTGAEVAHLKAIGLWEGFFGVANLVASDVEPALSLPSNCQGEGDGPDRQRARRYRSGVLQKLPKKWCESCARNYGAKAANMKTQSFRPGRPTPTHRYANAV